MSYPIQVKGSKPVQAFRHPAITLSWEGSKYLRLKMPTTTYLDRNDLSQLHVWCTEIDVGNGIPKDEGLKVLEPKSRDEMNVIVEANELIKGEINIPSSEYSPGNWHTACFLGLFYLNLFDQQGNAPDLSSKTLLERTSSWKVDQKSIDQHVDSSKIHWRSGFTLRSRDNSMPDIRASVHSADGWGKPETRRIPGS
ncbi:uncharacterized protein F4822DRAFT_435535 [Hypoxylon trugodes]|uniref:uncharacterized protein n=1 Tax=Hypoxylon trugodes TaxID=326681 RepID=UPI002195B847|nr:uncharacterized protein F4822DRAFT_435535 [Hypoxylon trugodes]KAI1382489.1 hypothetical protein F4822DRAFT_435535 [Hypoxylon trugodes]